MTEETANGGRKTSKISPLDNVAFVNDEGIPIGKQDDADKKSDGEKDEKPKSNEPPPVNFFKLFRFADKLDIFMMIIASIGSVVTGLSAPANTLIFGDLTNAMVSYGLMQQIVKNLTGSDVENPTLPANFSFIVEPIGRKEFFERVADFGLKNTGIGVILLVCSYLSIVLFSQAAQRQIFKIRTLYLQSALRQNIGWYDLNNTGDFASRMVEDLAKLEDGIGEKVVLFLHFMAAFVGSVTLALIKGWELALICLISLPVSAISMGVVVILSSKFSKNELEAYAKAGSIAEEVLTSIRTVIAFEGGHKELQRYEENLTEAKTNNIKKNFFSGFGFGLLWLLIYCSYALAFWYGVDLVFEPDSGYDAGIMTTVFFSVMMGSMNFGMSSPYLEVFSSARAAGAKVFSVIDRISPIDAYSEEGQQPTAMNGNIELRDVFFNYPSRPDEPILQGISLNIQKGQTVALVGSSGCGKSTCIQLIQRFYDPAEGQVLIDDVDVKDYNVKWMRQRIGVVGQEPVLFATTIAENIKYANENATMEDIINAAKMANVHDFISKLPKGYNTQVGERGAQMSGGQKQRVAIARALVRNPDILLLDEATSALDTASEAKVQAALEKASEGRTTVIVAHRLTTIRGADKIVVLSKGAVVEEGNHEELMKLKGHYYQLVTTQVSQPDDDAEEQENGDLGLSKRRDFYKQMSIISARSDTSDATEIHDENFTKLEDDEDDEKEKKMKPVSLMEVLKLNKEEWPYILIATLGAMTMGFITPIFSIVFGDILGVFDDGKEEAETQTNDLCIKFVILGVVMGVATFIQIYLYGIAGEILTMKVRSLTFRTFLKQEIAWFDRKANSVGALCAKLSGDSSSVQGATGQRIGSVIQSVATLGLAIGIAFWYEWRLALVAICFMPFLLAGAFFGMRLMRGNVFGSQDVLERSAKIAVEAVGNIRTVAGLCREKGFYEQYVKELKPANKIALRNNHLRGGIMGMSRSVVFFAYAACMFYGGQLIVYDKLDYTTVFKVSQALIMGTFSIANAFAFAPNFQKGLQAATKILKLSQRVPKVRDEVRDDPTSSWTAKGDVRYKEVEFRYPSRQEVKVLKGFSLDIFQGKTVALVGQSGCGKSTLIQLLERFYDPEAGAVSLDSVPIRSLKLSTLRNELGIVSQEPVLFDRTIAENIAYGDNRRTVDMNEIIEAAKQANIHTFITSLSNGYETRLGEKGAQLSGGQKQRVAIARALIRKPKVLLLDEATSALDTESEKVVQEALDKASEGRTCITIAHRLSTIQDADLIVVVNKGKVAETGKHAELLAKRGIYRHLYNLQSGSK